uniref:ribosomal protein S10 n=1 Tax=Cocconeiopsis kantsiensis TaxID=3082010 RepID=UPI0030027CD9
MIKYFSISVKSNNKNSYDEFNFLFNEINTNNIKKSIFKNKKVKKLTLLTSPHVNKKAQEQFETRMFGKQIKTHTFFDKSDIILFKKAKTKLFSDVKSKLALKCNFEKQSNSKVGLKLFCLDNFKLKKYPKKSLINFKKRTPDKTSFNLKEKVLSLLELFDLKSEFLKNCLNSSAGRAKD